MIASLGQHYASQSDALDARREGEMLYRVVRDRQNSFVCCSEKTLVCHVHADYHADTGPTTEIHEVFRHAHPSGGTGIKAVVDYDFKHECTAAEAGVPTSVMPFEKTVLPLAACLCRAYLHVVNSSTGCDTNTELQPSQVRARVFDASGWLANKGCKPPQGLACKYYKESFHIVVDGPIVFGNVADIMRVIVLGLVLHFPRNNDDCPFFRRVADACDFAIYTNGQLRVPYSRGGKGIKSTNPSSKRKDSVPRQDKGRTLTRRCVLRLLDTNPETYETIDCHQTGLCPSVSAIRGGLSTISLVRNRSRCSGLPAGADALALVCNLAPRTKRECDSALATLNRCVSDNQTLAFPYSMEAHTCHGPVASTASLLQQKVAVSEELSEIMQLMLDAYTEFSEGWKLFRSSNNGIAIISHLLRTKVVSWAHAATNSSITIDTTCNWCDIGKTAHDNNARHAALCMDLTHTPFTIRPQCFHGKCKGIQDSPVCTPAFDKQLRILRLRDQLLSL